MQEEQGHVHSSSWTTATSKVECCNWLLLYSFLGCMHRWSVASKSSIWWRAGPGHWMLSGSPRYETYDALCDSRLWIWSWVNFTNASYCSASFSVNARSYSSRSVLSLSTNSLLQIVTTCSNVKSAPLVDSTDGLSLEEWLNAEDLDGEFLPQSSLSLPELDPALGLSPRWASEECLNASLLNFNCRLRLSRFHSLLMRL